MEEINFELWNFFEQEHDLQLLDGQIDDIIMAVNKYNQKRAKHLGKDEGNPI